jgi:hypothetical protein
MDFVAIVDQVITLLRQRGRMTYRTLQRQFQLDDDALHDLTEELLYAHPEVRDDAGRGLVWTGDAGPAPVAPSAPVESPGQAPLAYTPSYLAEKFSPPVVPWKASVSRSPSCLPISKARRS